MFGKVDFREDGKKNERKRVEKTFLRVFGWEGERGKWWWGSSVFSPGSPKSFLSKMERKLNGRSLIGKWQRCPCALAHRLVQYVFFFLIWTLPLPSFPIFKIFLILFFLDVASSFSSSLFIYFYFLGRPVRCSSSSSLLFFFLFLFRHDFYFVINLGGCFLFLSLFVFCFNWTSFFNKGIWVNLYKFTFFIFPRSTPPTKQKRGKLKSFYPLTFPYSHYLLS